MVATEALAPNIITFKGRSMESFRDIETLKEFHRVLRRTLRPPVYSVFCAIEDHAGTNPPDGIPPFTCFASESTLAKEASVSRDTVIRAVKQLKGLGLIQTQDREGYPSLIWPLVTNQGYRTFMGEQEKRVLQGATSSTDQQGVLQKATGGVAETDTNETKLKKPNNETKGIEPGGSTRPANQSNDENQSVESQSNPSSRQVEVQVAASEPGERPGAGRDSPAKRPGRPAKPKEKEPDARLEDPRMVMWRKYADLAGYGPWPNELQRQRILDTVQLDNLTRWENVLKYWVGHDWQVKNIDGLLEVFVKGVKKRGT